MNIDQWLEFNKTQQIILILSSILVLSTYPYTEYQINDNILNMNIRLTAII